VRFVGYSYQYLVRAWEKEGKERERKTHADLDGSVVEERLALGDCAG